MVTVLLKVNESEKKEGKLKSTIALCRVAANLTVKEKKKETFYELSFRHLHFSGPIWFI